MSLHPEAPSLLQKIFTRRMLTATLMGFASGLPLLLTKSLLQAWMRESGIDISVIGLTALVGVPYSVKFLWAPVVDRFILSSLGRRRGWLLPIQLSLCLSIALLGFADPGRFLWLTIVAAFCVTFFSASQDIVIDAYRREDLPDEELGLGSSMAINGYRVGMLIASAGGLALSDHLPFWAVYALMAACMLPGILTTCLSPEPKNIPGTPRTLKEAVMDPLREYFSRESAILILAFILLYKIGDTMASEMATVFFLDTGFSKSEIAAVVKIFGFWATISGALAGGVGMLRIGINKSLWIAGVLQALSTACFALLAQAGPSLWGLSFVIAFENFSSGMGTSAYAAFMASLTNKKFTATQYALLTSFMGIPRTIASAPTGFMAKWAGWELFFVICALAAIPGMLLLFKCAPWKEKKT
ncbi:AmpG family muropeptide MFS transporter [Candidatus Desulfarcum epimagneticum]|uniref:AmpG family muropeptide MFS transporter n=1 Tax=uncultured Desulfobacteraceae bacterium TaxID=218296 RepID=A0A484HHN4_9BACT|nr:AmpG family muropeptide MFS transporter [uncultured Desulfobacteraceae bacterium]